MAVKKETASISLYELEISKRWGILEHLAQRIYRHCKATRENFNISELRISINPGHKNSIDRAVSNLKSEITNNLELKTFISNLAYSEDAKYDERIMCFEF